MTIHDIETSTTVNGLLYARKKNLNHPNYLNHVIFRCAWRPFMLLHFQVQHRVQKRFPPALAGSYTFFKRYRKFKVKPSDVECIYGSFQG